MGKFKLLYLFYVEGKQVMDTRRSKRRTVGCLNLPTGTSDSFHSVKHFLPFAALALIFEHCLNDFVKTQLKKKRAFFFSAAGTTSTKTMTLVKALRFVDRRIAAL